MEFLKKIRQWPDKKKKFFLWSVGIVLLLILFIIWFKIVLNRLSQINQSKIKESFSMPQLNLPPEEKEINWPFSEDLELEPLWEELTTNSTSNFEE